MLAGCMDLGGTNRQTVIDWHDKNCHDVGQQDQTAAAKERGDGRDPDERYVDIQVLSQAGADSRPLLVVGQPVEPPASMLGPGCTSRLAAAFRAIARCVL